MTPNSNTSQPIQAKRTLRVSEVIDGDTIKSGPESIRLIGIDTPERGEIGYEQAKQAMTELVLGKEISVVSGKDTYDKYGRSLSYIYRGDLFINKYMIEQGWAKTLFIEPNTQYAEEFLLLEQSAQQTGAGLWE